MTFGATISKQDQKPLAAALTVFAAVLAGSHLAFKSLTASTVAMAATLTKIVLIPLSATTVACAAVLMRGRLFVASTVAQSSTLTKTAMIPLSAATVAMSATLSGFHAVFISFTASTVAMA